MTDGVQRCYRPFLLGCVCSEPDDDMSLSSLGGDFAEFVYMLSFHGNRKEPMKQVRLGGRERRLALLTARRGR